MRALIISFLFAASCATGVLAFPPGSNGGWTDVTNSVGLGFNSRILAVADWSNSKAADLITVDSNNTVSVYTWSSGADSFFPTQQFYFGTEKVVSAVVADINRDGNVDLALTTDNGKLHIVYGPNSVVYDVLPGLPLNGAIPHLNVMPLYGGCAIPDLVVLTADKRLTVLANQIARSTSCDNIGGNASFIAEMSVNISSTVRLATFVAAVDFYGGCETQFLSPSSASNDVSTVLIIANTPGGQPLQTISVPTFFGVPTYGDLDGDGAMDIIFPTCVNPVPIDKFNTTFKCTAFNAAAVLNNNIEGSPCGDSSCCAGHGSRFASVSYKSGAGYTATGSFTLLPFNCQSQSPFEGTTSDAELLDSDEYPAIIRLLDYNRDRFADMIIGTHWGPMLLTNEGEGSSLACNALDLNRARASESFRLSVPFPFDITEDGSLDVIMFPTTTNGTIAAYWNGYGTDENYFFTATMLNGVTGDGYPFWGAVQAGAVHRFQWQDIDTHTRTATITQYASSSAHSLLLPHAHFGLGRTFSPIQNYGNGVRNGGGDHSRDWSAYLMPNSQVVVLANPITDPSGWTLRLFLYSLQYKKIILIALPTVLGMLGIPILVLKYREVQSDKAEKRQQMS